MLILTESRHQMSYCIYPIISLKTEQVILCTFYFLLLLYKFGWMNLTIYYILQPRRGEISLNDKQRRTKSSDDFGFVLLVHSIFCVSHPYQFENGRNILTVLL